MQREDWVAFGGNRCEPVQKGYRRYSLTVFVPYKRENIYKSSQKGNGIKYVLH